MSLIKDSLYLINENYNSINGQFSSKENTINGCHASYLIAVKFSLWKTGLALV